MKTLKNMNGETLKNLEHLGMLLASFGVQVSPSRVPFTYHHDAVRRAEGTLDRSDVARLLDHAYPTLEEQRLPLLCGMFIYLLQEQPAQVMRALHHCPEILVAFQSASSFAWDAHIKKLMEHRS